jgi:hypothetical protein
MIEGSRNTESAVDAGVVFYRHARNSTRLPKGNKLVASGMEKNVPDTPTFFDLYGVGDHRLETQNALVKLTSLVQVKC